MNNTWKARRGNIWSGLTRTYEVGAGLARYYTIITIKKLRYSYNCCVFWLFYIYNNSMKCNVFLDWEFFFFFFFFLCWETSQSTFKRKGVLKKTNKRWKGFSVWHIKERTIRAKEVCEATHISTMHGLRGTS